MSLARVGPKKWFKNGFVPSSLMELHAPCSCRASTVLLCASGASHTQAHWPPLALTLHFARCVYAHLPQLHPHRPSGFRRRTSLCRSYRRCFLFYDHADGISTRRDQIFSWYSPRVSSHRHGFPLCPVHRHAPAKDFLWVSFPNGKQFALYLKWSSFVPISRCLWTLRTGLPFAEAGYARFFTGRSLMVANDGHHTRRRTFHAVSFGAFAVG